MLHVVDAHVEEGGEVVELVVGELDDAVEAAEGVFEGDAVVGGEVAERAGGAVDDVHYVVRDVAAEALVEGVVFDGGEIDFGEFAGEIGAEGDEAVEDDDGRHADEIRLFERSDGGGEVADAIAGEAVQGAEGDGFDDDFHREVGELSLFGGGGDAVEEGEEAEGFAGFVGEGGEADFGVHLIGEAVEVEGALVALRGVVEEFEGAGADAGDHVGIGFAGDLLDGVVEASQVFPGAGNDVIERAEGADGEAGLGEGVDDLIDGIRHGVSYLPRAARLNFSSQASRSAAEKVCTRERTWTW